MSAWQQDCTINYIVAYYEVCKDARCGQRLRFCRLFQVDNPERLAVAVSDRHFGIGSDGLVLIMPSNKADCRMRMFNADGSEGMMCGNAIRCVGKYFFENIDSTKTTITTETASGIKRLELTVVNRTVECVGVDMGRADFTVKNVPFVCDKDEFIASELTADNRTFNATVLSMGNPHCVVFVDDVDAFDVERYGRAIENNPLFPERVNVEFVEIVDKDTIKMRVWERGSGCTLACGTGACASVAARNTLLPMDTEICVRLLGGDLWVKCASDYTMTMRGNAVEVFRGDYEL